MRTRITALPFALTVAFALFMPSFSMIDVFQAQTPEAMIITSTEVSPADATAPAIPWSVADEGDDDMNPFTPLVPPHVPLSAAADSAGSAILPPPVQHADMARHLDDALPPSLTQEVPTTPPLQHS